MTAMPRSPESHPLRGVLEKLLSDTNTMWRTGVIAEDSVVRDVEKDLVARQYSPRFNDGVWQAGSGEAWLAGTAEAAAALVGRGCAWSMHDLRLLPRGEDECVASYRIVHAWGDYSAPPAQAVFLETWRLGGDGRWRLARHTAEKV